VIFTLSPEKQMVPFGHGVVILTALGDNTIIIEVHQFKYQVPYGMMLLLVVCHSLARKTDGTLWAWGAGGGGRLGDNTIISKSSPVQIPGTAWNDISAGNNGSHSLARKTDGTLWAWGLGHQWSTR
jgi:alpha-tubulin suppressor-like RCC1 family protein